MAAGAASTGSIASIYPSLKGPDESVLYLAATPGANATWTKFATGTTTSDSAFADAGHLTITAGGVEYRIPVFTAT